MTTLRDSGAQGKTWTAPGMPKLNYSYNYSFTLSRSICYSWNQNLPQPPRLKCEYVSFFFLANPPPLRPLFHISHLTSVFVTITAFYPPPLSFSLLSSSVVYHLFIMLIPLPLCTRSLGQADWNTAPHPKPNIDFRAGTELASW